MSELDERESRALEYIIRKERQKAKKEVTVVATLCIIGLVLLSIIVK